MGNSLTSQQFLFGNKTPWEDLGDGIQRQILGYNDTVMMVNVKFEAGAIGAMHKHHHTQATYVASGVFEITIDGNTQTLGTGDSFFVPPNTMHGALCKEAGQLIDTFSPIREDFLGHSQE